GDFAAEVAFHRELGDLRTQRSDLGLGEVFHERFGLDAGGSTRLLRLRPTDAIDMGESHPYVLVHRYIDTGDTGHCEHSPRRKARNYITKNLATQCLNLGPGAWAPAQPCLCLCRASLLQITYTTRRRRTILQFLQIFLTEARTFIALS